MSHVIQSLMREYPYVCRSETIGRAAHRALCARPPGSVLLALAGYPRGPNKCERGAQSSESRVDMHMQARL